MTLTTAMMMRRNYEDMIVFEDEEAKVEDDPDHLEAKFDALGS